MSNKSKVRVEDMTPYVLDYCVALVRCEVKLHKNKRLVWPMFHKMRPFILEGERISTVNMGGHWLAWSPQFTQTIGPTLMLAGLRCYVISKLGAAVEVPAEVLQEKT